MNAVSFFQCREPPQPLQWCSVTSQKTGMCTYIAVKTSKLSIIFPSNCSSLKNEQPVYCTDTLSRPSLFQVESSPANTLRILLGCFIIYTETLRVGWVEVLRGVMHNTESCHNQYRSAWIPIRLNIVDLHACAYTIHFLGHWYEHEGTLSRNVKAGIMNLPYVSDGTCLLNALILWNSAFCPQNVMCLVWFSE
jgi:hypothetical protein